MSASTPRRSPAWATWRHCSHPAEGRGTVAVGALDLVVGHIRRSGPLAFDEFVELALYSPQGFYGSGRGRAGRRGDFVTSPELGPLFGAVLARSLDAWWAELGRPDPYVVVEAGAGVGTLARSVLDTSPRCAAALRYVLVERSEALREQQRARLSLEPAALVLGPVVPEDGLHDGPDDGPDDLPDHGPDHGPDEGEEPRIEQRPGSLGAPSERGVGPMVAGLAELPAEPVTGVVLANELLDNLPFSLLVRQAGGWDEVRVGEARGELVEVLVPARAADAALAGRLAPLAPVGGRIPVLRAAASWLGRALSVVERGRVVVVDYADTTASLACRPWTEWVRTYRGQGRGAHPLAAPGLQDITCEVAIDQLTRVRAVDRARTQAEFLRAHGLDELVESARATWSRRAVVADLEALRARSRVFEAEALVDPGGLGAFLVLEWAPEWAR